jgi:hypothetical protein
MAVSYVNNGGFTITTGSGTAPAPAYPASIVSGNLLVIVLTNKYGAVTTPSGWTAPTNYQATGGTGAAASDAGNETTSVFYKVADGTETGSVTITIAASTGASAVAIIHQFSKGSGAWDIAACSAGYSPVTPSLSFSITMGTDPDITSGDLLLYAYGNNGDAFTYGTNSVTATGATIAAVANAAEGPATTGQDCELRNGTAAVTAGTGTAAPILNITATGTATATSPAGSAVILRLREGAAPAARLPLPISINQSINRASTY